MGLAGVSATFGSAVTAIWGRTIQKVLSVFSSLDYPSSQYSVVFGSTLSTKLGGLGRGRGLAYRDVSV